MTDLKHFNAPVGESGYISPQIKIVSGIRSNICEGSAKGEAKDYTIGGDFTW